MDTTTETDTKLTEVTAATSASTDLPLAERDTPWDGPAAHNALVSWAGGANNLDTTRFGRGHFWHSPDPSKVGDFKLPFATVRDGRLVAVPAGVFAAAAALQGARGGVDIPAADVAAVRAKIGAYYRRLNARPPWVMSADGSYEDDEDKRRRARHGDRVTASMLVDGIVASVNEQDGTAVVVSVDGPHTVPLEQLNFVDSGETEPTLALTASALTAAIAQGVQEGFLAATAAMRRLAELETRINTRTPASADTDGVR